jgi:hypothetical protein
VKVVRGFGRFPHRALRRLAVAHEDVRAVVRLDAARVQRRADASRQALTERSRGDVDELEPRRRVAFEVVVELAKLEQFLVLHEADLRPRGVQQRRGMALRQHEAIVVRVTRVGRVEPHLGEEQRGHEIRGRGARGRMTAAGGRRRANRIDAKSGRDVVEHGHEPGAILRHGTPDTPSTSSGQKKKSISFA